MPASSSLGSAAIGAAAGVASSAIMAIANSGSQRAQVAALQLQGRLSQLNDQQQYDLAMQLNNSKTEAERLSIMNNAISSIDTATTQGTSAILLAAQNNQQSSTMTTAIVIGASVIVLIGAIFIINKL